MRPLSFVRVILLLGRMGASEVGVVWRVFAVTISGERWRLYLDKGDFRFLEAWRLAANKFN